MFECPVALPAAEVLQSRLENMRRRVKAVSKGLLEAEHRSYDPGTHSLLYYPGVTFLHRTVRDYFQTPEAQLMLQCWLDDPLNCDLEICKSVVTLSKMVPREAFARRTYTLDTLGTVLANFWDRPHHCLMFHALRLDQNTLCQDDLALLLEDLQAVLKPALEQQNTRETCSIGSVSVR